jgi:hypothetical protein
MKRTAKFIILLFAILLTSTTASAHSGYSGYLWDSASPPAPWEHGATIYAINCNADGSIIGDELYGTTVLGIGETSFSEDWGGPQFPGINDYVCLYVSFNFGGTGQPTDVITEAIPYLSFVAGRMNFGNIQTGTGPTAVELVDFNVTSQTNSNNWLPFILLVSSIALVSGAVTLIRKRRD